MDFLCCSNVSARLPGRPTNNRAEIHVGFIFTTEYFKENKKKIMGKKENVYFDSIFMYI